MSIKDKKSFTINYIQEREYYKKELHSYADSLTKNFFDELLRQRIKLELISEDILYDKVYSYRDSTVFSNKRFRDLIDVKQLNLEDLNDLHYYKLYPFLTSFEERIKSVNNLNNDKDYDKLNVKYWILLANKLQELLTIKYKLDFLNYLPINLSTIVTNYLFHKIQFFIINHYLKTSTEVTHAIIEYEEHEYLVDLNFKVLFAEVIDDEFFPITKSVLNMEINDTIPTNLQRVIYYKYD